MTDNTPGFEFDGLSAAVAAVHAACGIYTSQHVVDEVLDRINWPAAGGSMLDPGCGDGAFLLRALARLPLVRDDVASTARVRGFEFHPGAVVDARDNIVEFLTGSRGWSEARAREASRAIVTEVDFLIGAVPRQDVDWLVGNPPYLRFASWPAMLKELYGKLPRFALGDLQHAFLAKCCEFLSPQGQIGFITSDRWMMNAGAGELRAQLGERFGIRHLARLDARTSFYRPKSRRVRGAPPRIHPIMIILRPADASTRPLTREPVSISGYVRDESLATLGEIAETRICPWLGKEGIFFMEHEAARRIPGGKFLPIVDTDDIDPVHDVLLNPYRVALLTDHDVEPTGAVLEHLLSKRHEMAERGDKRPYWLPPETIVPLNQPSLLIPRIARRLRAIPLPAGVLAMNHNLTIVAQNGVMSLDELAALITSPECQEWARSEAPAVEGGFFSITTTLLRRMPVPYPALRAAA